MQSGSFEEVLRWIFSNGSRTDIASRALQGLPALGYDAVGESDRLKKLNESSPS